MFKPSNFDMTDVKFLKFKNGQSVSTLRNRAQASDGWDCYLPIACVAWEKQPFLLAPRRLPGETSAPQEKKSIAIIPIRIQMQAKSSGAEFSR